MLDLLQTGKFGVLTNQKFLGTTSNNITNVNTDGYVRQETHVFTSAIDWGIGATYTRRMYDRYAQREMFRDQGNVGFYDAYATGLANVDNMLSNKDTSIGTSINSIFSSMNGAVQNTTSLANRRELLTQFQNMVNRYHTLNSNIKNELNDANARVSDTVSTINDLVKNIYEVNRQVRNMGDKAAQSETGMQLLDKRDQLVNELSKFVDLNVTKESDGSLSLYLGNGQLLVNGDTHGILHVEKDALDPSRRDVSISFNNGDKTKYQIGHDGWGGKLGGLLSSTDEIRQSMRDLGQLAIAFADAMNQQNRAGITLEGKAGQDLISIPAVNGVSNNSKYHMQLTFNPGEGEDIRSCDYRVITNDAGELEVYAVEGDKLTKIDSKDIELSKNLDDPKGFTIKLKGHGVTLNFTGGSYNQMVADKNLQFGVQPTMNAAYDIQCVITKPEEFAFASAIRVNTNKHDGNAVGSLVGVFETAPNAAANAQNPIYIGSDGLPKLAGHAPAYVEYNSQTKTYDVYTLVDGEDGKKEKGELIGSAPETCKGQNIFANTEWTEDYQKFLTGKGVNFDKERNPPFPGYDVNFTGTVSHGSSFQIELNLDGENDNSNGNLMAAMQHEDLVKSSSSDSVHTTFTGAYANLTSAVGSAVMSATTDLRAASAKCEQSTNMFYSVSGVNLDEEAANLIRYQQSYSACAKIINASQTIFDALIRAI